MAQAAQDKRRYSRVLIDKSAEMVVRGPHSKQDRRVPITIYQLGPGGCGLLCGDKDVQKYECVYLYVFGETEKLPLKICGQVVWKSMDTDGSVHYGLEFLWIRKDEGEEVNDGITLTLNEILRPTGYSLLPK